LHTVRPNKVYADAAYAGGIKAALPQQLVEVIEASLARTPRNFLFTTHSSKDHPFTKKSYGNRVRKTLRETTGNSKICPTILRHIYVTAMYKHYKAALEGAEGPQAQAQAKAEISKSAHLMAHSLNMHERYRFDLSEEDEPVPMEAVRLTAHDIPLLSAVERNAPLSVRCL
jgi:integrase